jgi:hypothetical protein
MRRAGHSRAAAPAVALLAVCAVALATAIGSGDAAPRDPACTASVIHPLRVRVTALDPVARGALVRLRVIVTSTVPIERAEARLVSAGGAQNRGPSSLALGSLVPGAMGQTIFTVAVPSSGGRQYVQLQVTGSGPEGRLTRGACYNLLPDGRAETPRTIVTTRGQRVIEVGARRIDR